MQALAPALKERYADLVRYHLPATLAHGDLHLGNVARGEQGYLFFDWSDSCIAHPFVDMIAPYFFYDDAATQAQMRDDYLTQWSEWESMDRLLEVWRLAKPLAALHQAVSYLHILIGQEELIHSEMADGLQEFIAYTISSIAEKERPQPKNV